MAFDAGRRAKIIDFLNNKPGGALHSFFVVHGYGSAYDELDKGWGRAKRVAHVLTLAEREGREQEILLAAEQLMRPEDRFPHGFEFSGGTIETKEDGSSTFTPDRFWPIPPPKPLGWVRHRLQDLQSDLTADEGMLAGQAEAWVAEFNAAVTELERHVGDKAPEAIVLSATATDGNFLTAMGRRRFQGAVDRALGVLPPQNHPLDLAWVTPRLREHLWPVIQLAQSTAKPTDWGRVTREATLFLETEMRQRTGLESKGRKELASDAFKPGGPLAFKSDVAWQEGWKLYVMGILIAFGNPGAHTFRSHSQTLALGVVGAVSTVLTALDEELGGRPSAGERVEGVDGSPTLP